MLVTLPCSLLANSFAFIGPAQTVAPFLLFTLGFLRHMVGRVSEFLVRTLPYGLSDASV